MKSNITLPLIQLVAKPYIGLTIIILILFIAALKWLPESTKQLTIFDNNTNIYETTCPALTSIKLNDENAIPELKSPFTLLNWNIYKQQRPHWLQALQELTLNVDFITLQEAKSSAVLDQFTKDINFSSLHNIAFKYNQEGYGVNTLSKYTSRSVCGSLATEPWIQLPKSAIAAVYPIEKGSDSLLLINLHAINFTITISPFKEQLDPYITMVKKHHGPIIFSGDFNTWSNDRLTFITDIFMQLGFKEVLFDDDNRSIVFDHPLDHIYFRGLKVLAAESIINQASDHNPIRVKFAFE